MLFRSRATARERYRPESRYGGGSDPEMFGRIVGRRPRASGASREPGGGVGKAATSCVHASDSSAAEATRMGDGCASCGEYGGESEKAKAWRAGLFLFWSFKRGGPGLVDGWSRGVGVAGRFGSGERAPSALICPDSVLSDNEIRRSRVFQENRTNCSPSAQPTRGRRVTSGPCGGLRAHRWRSPGSTARVELVPCIIHVVYLV